MQGIFRKENTDKALKYGIYRHLQTYEKIIRNLVSFYTKSIRFPSWFLFNKNLFPQPVDFRALKCYINSCMHYY